MPESRTFPDVNQALFDATKKASQQAHNTAYDPPSGNKGTATTPIPLLGNVVVAFDFNPGANSLTYTIVTLPKGGLPSASQVFDGIDATIGACRYTLTAKAQ
jgi:hypothetical protein